MKQRLNDTIAVLQQKTLELEAANRAKDDFMANMSHELRTPLNAILGFAELLSDEIPGKLNEDQKSCLNDILDSSAQLLKLIDGLLNIRGKVGNS